MPQVNQGQVQPGVDGAPQIYGTGNVENTIPFQERCHKLFKPQEFVNIKNIDDEPLYWQYMSADNETETFSEDGMQRMVNRGTPEMWMIAPGEVEPLVGASAYLALDTLYKKMAAKKTLRRYSDPSSPLFDDKGQHLPKNFNFADGGAAEAFLKQAYLGKAVPNFADFQSPTVNTPVDDNSVESMAAKNAKQLVK